MATPECEKEIQQNEDQLQQDEIINEENTKPLSQQSKQDLSNQEIHENKELNHHQNFTDPSLKFNNIEKLQTLDLSQVQNLTELTTPNKQPGLNLQNDQDEETIFSQFQNPNLNSQDEQLKIILECQDEGRQLLKQQKYELAGKKFSEAMLGLRIMSEGSMDSMQQMLQDQESSMITYLGKPLNLLTGLIIPCHNNLGLVSLKLNNFKNCLKFSEKTLSIQPENTKILARKGRALYELNECEEARDVFQYIIKLNKEELALSREYLKKCQLKLKQSTVKRKEVNKKMIDMILSEDRASEEFQLQMQRKQIKLEQELKQQGDSQPHDVKCQESGQHDQQLWNQKLGEINKRLYNPKGNQEVQELKESSKNKQNPRINSQNNMKTQNTVNRPGVLRQIHILLTDFFRTRVGQKRLSARDYQNILSED